MLGDLITWIESHEVLVWSLGVSSVVMFFGTLLVIPILVARIPADYFTRKQRPEDSFLARYPMLRLFGLIIKNIFGFIFLLAGILMLVLPGQGILTMLIGISLMNFPGKRQLELKIIRQPTVYRAINWMRAKAHKPPLQLPRQFRSQLAIAPE